MSDSTTISNTMQATVTIVPPPSTTVDIQPIKDAYIDFSEPVFNQGIGEDLLVKHNSTSEEKILIAFKVPAIDQVSLENLNYAHLTFTRFNSLVRSGTLLLKSNNNYSWSESGVTWANQPTENDVILSTAQVVSGQKTIVFDLLPLIQANNVDTYYTFTIEEQSDSDKTTPIYISARESSTPPVLEYNFNFYPDNVNIIDMAGSLIVRRNNTVDIAGSLIVANGMAVNDLSGSLLVKKYTTSSDVNCKLITVKKNLSDINGKLNINLYSATDNGFNGKLFTRFSGQSFLNGSLTIKLKNGQQDLSGSITSAKSGQDDLNGSLKLLHINSESNLNGSIVVRKNDIKDLPGSVKINSYNSNYDANGSIIVRRQAEVDLPGSLNVKLYNGNADLSGSMAISAIGEKDLTGKVTVNYYSGNKDVDCKINVSYREDINGSMTVVQNGKIDIVGTIVSRPRYYKDVSGSFKVVHDVSYAFIM